MRGTDAPGVMCRSSAIWPSWCVRCGNIGQVKSTLGDDVGGIGRAVGLPALQDATRGPTSSTGDAHQVRNDICSEGVWHRPLRVPTTTAAGCWQLAGCWLASQLWARAIVVRQIMEPLRQLPMPSSSLVESHGPQNQNTPTLSSRTRTMCTAAASCPLLRPRSLACRRPTSTVTSESCSWNSRLWEHLIPLEKTFNVKTRNLPFRLSAFGPIFEHGVPWRGTCCISLSTLFVLLVLRPPVVHGILATRTRGSFDSLPACNTSFVFFFHIFFQLVNYAHISTHCRLTVSFVVPFEPTALIFLLFRAR